MGADEILVRHARRAEIPRLVAIEEQIWGSLGTKKFGSAHFTAWFETHPAGILVAESALEIVGYTYTQLIHFSFADIPRMRSFDEITDCGFTKNTHVPDGSSLFGVTIGSIKRGAGRKLHAANLTLTGTLDKTYFVATPRLAGFDRYMRLIEATRAVRNMTPLLETRIALWYARECTRMLGGIIWPSCPPDPGFALPQPEKPDPVLAAHIGTHKNFGLAAVLPEFMQDPQSRNYAALCVYQPPPPN